MSNILGTAKKMWALDSPTVTIDSSVMMVGTSGPVTVPMPAYLIEHPQGVVLFDTGLPPEAYTDPEAVYGPMAELFNLAAREEQRLDRQLPQLGYAMSDVTHVVLSHAHFDHAGGVAQFPDAKLYAGQGELRYAMWPDPAGAGYFRQADVEPTRGWDWREIPGRDLDLFGDGSVVVLWTPGHTPGSCSLLVRLPGRNFVLSGDVVYLRAQLEAKGIPPIVADSAENARSIDRLRLAAESADATIWVGHDPGDWAEFGSPHCHE